MYFKYYFDLCFPDKDISYFKNYISIVSYRLKNKLEDGTYFERHYIIPRIWLSIMGEQMKEEYFRDIDVKRDIVVNLSIKEHLKVHILLLHYYLNCNVDKLQMNEFQKKDIIERILRQLVYMTGFSRGEILRKGDLSEREYEEYERRIISEKRIKFMNRDQSDNKRVGYDLEFFKMCLEIYGRSLDWDEGFQNVVKETGYCYSRRALCENFKKYFSVRYLEILEKQRKWYNETKRIQNLQRRV